MNKIKWFFATNKESNEPGKNYIDFIKSAVLSAKQNAPSLEPYCIYDGEHDSVCEWLEKHDVKVILHKFSLYELFSKSQIAKSQYFMKIAGGAYLRVDIPIILEKYNITDDIILYTDCDIMFMNDIKINEIGAINILSAGPESNINEKNHINTGVIFFNTAIFKNYYNNFLEFIKNNFEKSQTYDQDLFNQFFSKKWNNLNPEFNWKPYWGFNSNAKIIHFHGPKPSHKQAILSRKDFIPNFFYQMAPKAYFDYVEIWEKFLQQA